MLTALAILGVLAVLFLVTALATSDRQALAPATPDAADVVLPSGRVGADDVRALRFGLAARGYRMSEVDAALSRLAEELEERDRVLAELRDGAAAHRGSGPAEPVLAPTTSAPTTGLPDVPGDVVAAVPAVDPDAAGEAGAAAVDLPAPPVPDDAHPGQGGDRPQRAPETSADAAPPRPSAITFPMDFPEVQTADEPGTAGSPLRP